MGKAGGVAAVQAEVVTGTMGPTLVKAAAILMDGAKAKVKATVIHGTQG